MSIRTKLALSFAIIVGMSVITFYYHLYEEWKEAEGRALFDAQSAAMPIALTLTYIDESAASPPMYKMRSRLNDYIDDMRRLLNQDIVVVDVQKKILADAFPKNIGKTFEQDKNNEVGLTIKDGGLRTFTEKSSDYPEGIKQLALPLKTEEGKTVGAIIFDYTSYYNNHVSDVKNDARNLLIESFFLALLVAAIGYFLSAKIAGPVIRLKKAAEEIAKGNLDGKIDVESSDEIGMLAAAFNDMAALRQKTEEALRSSEENFRTVAEFAGDAIIGIRPPGVVYLWNRQAKEIFGYSEDEAMSKNIHDLITPERHKEKALDGLINFFKTGDGPVVGATFGIEALRKDGTEFPVELSISAVNMQGEWRAIGIVRDITERKKAQEEIERLNKELLEKIEKLERFHKITVNRELRIIGIKKEVNELLEKAGEPKRYEWADKAER